MTTNNTILRNRLFAREQRRRGFVACRYCGVGLNAFSATLDHVVPKARGGTNEMSNLALACLACNNAKGDRLPGEPVRLSRPIKHKKTTEVPLCDLCALPGRLIRGIVDGRPGHQYHPRCLDLAKRYAPVVSQMAVVLP